MADNVLPNYSTGDANYSDSLRQRGEALFTTGILMASEVSDINLRKQLN